MTAAAAGAAAAATAQPMAAANNFTEFMGALTTVLQQGAGSHPQGRRVTASPLGERHTGHLQGRSNLATAASEQAKARKTSQRERAGLGNDEAGCFGVRHDLLLAEDRAIDRRLIERHVRQ